LKAQGRSADETATAVQAEFQAQQPAWPRANGIAALAPLSDAATMRATAAERAFGRVLAGNCRTPLAAYATDRGPQLWLRGLVASRDGSQVLRGERFAAAGTVEEAAALGEALGAEFLQRGAAAMLAESL
jgi:hydroxymethylbilane synthase